MNQLTDEQIAQELNITNPEIAQSVVQNVRTTVESRFANLLAELLSEEQLNQVEAMQQSDQDFQTIETWVFQQVPDAQEAYESLLQDHLDELKNKAKDILG